MVFLLNKKHCRLNSILLSSVIITQCVASPAFANINVNASTDDNVVHISLNDGFERHYVDNIELNNKMGDSSSINSVKVVWDEGNQRFDILNLPSDVAIFDILWTDEYSSDYGDIKNSLTILKIMDEWQVGQDRKVYAIDKNNSSYTIINDESIELFLNTNLSIDDINNSSFAISIADSGADPNPFNKYTDVHVEELSNNSYKITRSFSAYEENNLSESDIYIYIGDELCWKIDKKDTVTIPDLDEDGEADDSVQSPDVSDELTSEKIATEIKKKVQKDSLIGFIGNSTVISFLSDLSDISGFDESHLKLSTDPDTLIEVESYDIVNVGSNGDIYSITVNDDSVLNNSLYLFYDDYLVIELINSQIANDDDRNISDKLKKVAENITCTIIDSNAIVFIDVSGQDIQLNTDKLSLSSTEGFLTKITEDNVSEIDGAYIYTFTALSDVDLSDFDKVSLFYGDYFIKTFSSDNSNSGDEDIGDENSEYEFSLKTGLNVLSFNYGLDALDETIAKDTISLIADKEINNAPLLDSFRLSKNSEYAELVGIGIDYINVESDKKTVTLGVSAKYESIKNLDTLYLFYDDKLIGEIEISISKVEPPKVSLGSDTKIFLEYSEDSNDDSYAEDTISYISDTTLQDASNFELQTIDTRETLRDVSFILGYGNTIISRVKKSVPEGIYNLLFMGAVIGQVNIEHKGPEDASFSVVNNSIQFEYPYYSTNETTVTSSILLDVSNIKNEILAENFSLKKNGQVLDDCQIMEFISQSDGLYLLNISHKYFEGILDGIELYYKDSLITSDILMSAIKLPNTDPSTVATIHETLAYMQGERVEDGVLPTANLEYDESYANDKSAQALILQSKMQGWIDACVESGYTEWSCATIKFIYDEVSGQFKSTISLRNTTSSAKAWTVVVASKPVEDSKPFVDTAELCFTKDESKNINISLGTGLSAAKRATITVDNEDVLWVNANQISVENLENGLVVKGLKAGETTIHVTFDDENKTSYDISVKVLAKTFSITSSVNNDDYGYIVTYPSDFDGIIEENKNLTYIFNANNGYKLGEVLVDGVSVDVKENQYVFENISSNHTIFVQFVEKETSQDILPSVNTSAINIKQSSTAKVSVDLGSGIHLAKNAYISVKDSSIATCNISKMDINNIANGIVITGKRAGQTTLEIRFDNFANTVIQIPITIASNSSNNGSNSGSSNGSSSGGSTTTNTKPNVSYNTGGSVTVLSNNKTVIITPNAGYIIKDVVVNGKSVGSIEKYEFEKASSSNTLSVTFEKIKDTIINPPNENGDGNIGNNNSGNAGNSDTSSFNDIVGHWAANYINKFASLGYIKGVSDGIFAPDMSMTRGMFVTILSRMEDVQEKYSSIGFTDVQSGLYYSNAVAWAKAVGITSGVDDLNFAPDRNITREEMATMICRYLKYKGGALNYNTLDKFVDDNEISDWSKPYVYALKNLGVVQGVGNNRFNSKNTASRAELVTVLCRILDL